MTVKSQIAVTFKQALFINVQITYEIKRYALIHLITVGQSSEVYRTTVQKDTEEKPLARTATMVRATRWSATETEQDKQSLMSQFTVQHAKNKTDLNYVNLNQTHPQT